MHILRSDDYLRMPWANGGGTTLEVARYPETGDFDWRISIADVTADGAFSDLPGVDRVITLTEGAWMRLDVDGEEVVLQPQRPFAFQGESDVVCTVPEPTRDLNVMTRRGVAVAEVEVRDTPLDLEEGTIVVCLDDEVRLDSVALSPYDAAFVDAPTRAEGPGRVVVIRIAFIDG